ncbi:hypothetical protein LK07_22860 [Streptomyces pluripotens]|uniref:TPM domain-containing protein n=1 Tax=Streptomyces pluripotens TaxID=1355015 RepID=A0A221P2T5_9ACTN|nr:MULTISPECIES: hypothetical protein [Streptomyces]ARP72129.1 hypothetical protein LK06_021705 [Streptomyces pluripotens]ASN26376.1 hypothetical protein LK07_22860 [Streptomyces pluripotens]MCH0555986.1 hypothetical protein [Streptomyces sp. MUM 16J]
MTSSLIRGRPRHAKAHIRVRVVHAALGAAAGVGWLVLPVMTDGDPDPVPPTSAEHVTVVTAQQQGGTSTADLVLPLVAGGVAVVVAGYGYLRRTRRARTRTTPGIVSAHPPVAAPAESERQAGAALRLADDCVRTSREELFFVRERFGEAEAEPLTHALRAAETELSAAFAIWSRYEEGAPQTADARRQALVGVVGRCAEAGRQLDAQATALDRLRGLEQELGGALEIAEERFRKWAARTAAAQTTLTALRDSYPPAAVASIIGYTEQAKDRLVFATARLNQARQADDAADRERAAAHLRAAEGAISQTDVLVGGVERLAARLHEATALVPTALTGAETVIARARKSEAGASLAAGELHARLAHADRVLTAVREELTTGPYDPLDALRRITRAVARLEAGWSGVLSVAVLLVARASVSAAEEFVTVHLGTVGTKARAQLSQAERALAAGDADQADVVSRKARELAELDVRAHGNPYAAGSSAGLASAVLGGILLGEDLDGGPPAGFGGPETRGRLRVRADP